MITTKQLLLSTLIATSTSTTLCMEDKTSLLNKHKKKILLAQCAQTLKGPADHLIDVTSIAYDPHDPNKLAAGSWNSTIRIWDLEQQKCSTTLTQQHRSIDSATAEDFIISAIAYNSQQQQLASGSHDATINLWNSENYKANATLTGHTRWILTIAYNLDNSRLISGAEDKMIKLWDPQTGKCTATYTNNSAHISSIACSPDSSNNIASGLGNGTIILRDIRTREPITIFQTNTSEVSGVAYHPRGTKLVSISKDGTIAEWDLRNNETLELLSTARDYIYSGCVAYHPRGKEFATGSSGTVTLRNPLEIKLTGHYGLVGSIAYNHDGTRLASGAWNDTIKIWNLPLIEKISDDDLDADKVTLLEKLAHNEELSDAEKQLIASMGFNPSFH